MKYDARFFTTPTSSGDRPFVKVGMVPSRSECLHHFRTRSLTGSKVGRLVNHCSRLGSRQGFASSYDHSARRPVKPLRS